VHTGLVGGEIDLYPEYGCIALPVMLRAQMDTDRNSMLERLRDEYASRFRALWLDPLGFDGRCLVAVRQSDAAKLKLTKMSDLSRRKDGWLRCSRVSRETGFHGCGIP
jgi:glycine betaine/choline ABC-type transport system substrate-binding protein